MSAVFDRLLARAKSLGREQVHIGVTRGGLVVMLARPNGHGGAAEARNHADAYLYVGRIRDQLDNPGPDVRGPAADRQREART